MPMRCQSQYFELTVISACLCASGSLDTPETEILPAALKVLQILQQILDPQACTLSDSGQLRGLKMGVSQTRKGLVCIGESGELLDDSRELREQNVQSVSQEDLTWSAQHNMSHRG
jgi:hypothetical protein